MNPDHPATIAQVTASNPKNSTWLSANAGSGKTKVLTDRVAPSLAAWCAAAENSMYNLHQSRR